MNKINLMSDDIGLTSQKIDVSTMSGDVTLHNCEGTVETMSGDIELVGHLGKIVQSMSGDINIEKSTVRKIETMSGDITLDEVYCNVVSSMSGDITINKCEIDTVVCSELFGDNSNVTKIIVRDNSEYISIYKEISGFKWWNPFTWGTIQKQVCGDNSINIQGNNISIGKDITINNGRKYIDGECQCKSKRPRTFRLPDTIKVKVVEFDNGRKDNILKSKHEVKVINGKWVKWD